MAQIKPHYQTETDRYKKQRDKKVGFYTYAGYRSLQYLPGTNPYFHITHAGEERCEPGHTFAEVREEYHLHIIMSGRGVFQTINQSAELEGGDIFIAPRHQDYFYQADLEDPWHYVWVAFSGSRVDEYLEMAGFAADRLIRKAYAPPEQYADIIYSILETRNLTRANELRRMSKLYALFSLLIRSRLNYSNDKNASIIQSRNESINHAIQYIQSSYQSVTVTKLAQYVGLNRSYLSTLFRSEMKVSPQKYILKYKMEKAATLLETTAKPVSEVAAAVGYDEPFNFSRAFHTEYGISPREYRNMHANHGTY